MSGKYIRKPKLSPGESELLSMEVGDAIIVTDNMIIHRVPSGWIYQFKRDSTGMNCMAVTFVPLNE